MKALIANRYLTTVFMAITSLLAFVSICLAADKQKQGQLLNQVSHNGYLAIQEVGFARVAILDGQLKEARKLITDAQEHLTLSKREVPNLAVIVSRKLQKQGSGSMSPPQSSSGKYVPIDAGLTVTEDFVVTPENARKIKAANEEMRAGNQDKADALIHETGLGVSVTRFLLPIDYVAGQLEKAASLFNKQKYYAANLTLKDAVNSLVVDTVKLNEAEHDHELQHKKS